MKQIKKKIKKVAIEKMYLSCISSLEFVENEKYSNK
jgi:hypothetical protein